MLPCADTDPATPVCNGAAEFGIGDIGFYSAHYSAHVPGSDVEAVCAVTQHQTGRLIVAGDRTTSAPRRSRRQDLRQFRLDPGRGKRNLQGETVKTFSSADDAVPDE